MGCRALVVLTVVAACGFAFAAPAGAGTTTDTSGGSSTQPSTVEELFVQTADGGTLQPVAKKPGVYTLTLQGVPQHVTTFTDRPLRVRSELGVEQFVNIWDGGSFAADPPNAALVITDAPTSRDTFIFELTKPRYDAKSKRLRYTATLIDAKPTGRLANFADAVDMNPPKKFGRASLFVDSLPSTSMTVTISGLPANGIGGYIVDGFNELADTAIQQGNVRNVVSTTDGVVVVTGAQDGTATVVLKVYYCVNPGTTSASVTLSGSSPGTTVTFDLGTGDQTFTAPGTLQVPSSYQLVDCGQ